MKRKTKALVLFIIGFYFFFINTVIILFLPFHYPMIPTPYDFELDPIDPVRYWTVWFQLQGWQALVSVLIGITFIVFGSRYFVIKHQ
ncbi:MAG: hypothetical protein KGD65_00885 [Candidatus Lokiarchaeota archaeon]|nr:hypothetical protein [Candidatus Lokiarchaeota archaeon]